MEDKNAVKATTHQRIEEVLANSRSVRAEAEAYLKANGIEYKKDTTKWLTINSYCTKFGIEDPQTIHDWIESGVIAPENIQIIEGLEEFKRVKAILYK